MKIAIVAITENGYATASKLSRSFPDSSVYFPSKSGEGKTATLFRCKVSELAGTLFAEYDGIIFCMALGLVIRVIAPYIKSKYSDPAIVVVDEAARYAISALSGHEGGANDLAIKVGNILSAQPVITTASESAKNIVIGVGCRRGIKKEEVIEAVEAAVSDSGHIISDVSCIATIDIKQDEAGLLEACKTLGVPFRIVSSDMIRYFKGDYHRSDFVNEKIGVEGVCEPCALLVARRPELIAPKKVFSRVTIAIAKEG